MKKYELPPKGVDCLGETKCVGLVAQLDKIFEELRSLGADAELSLRLEAELDMWRARRALYEQQTKEIQGFSVADFLASPSK